MRVSLIWLTRIWPDFKVNVKNEMIARKMNLLLIYCCWISFFSSILRFVLEKKNHCTCSAWIDLKSFVYDVKAKAKIKYRSRHFDAHLLQTAKWFSEIFAFYIEHITEQFVPAKSDCIIWLRHLKAIQNPNLCRKVKPETTQRIQSKRQWQSS